MTYVPPTSTTGSATQTQQLSKTQVDYQSFLKLLVAQMKNQDPTDPMDSTQYVAQLAAFSQVEQAVSDRVKEFLVRQPCVNLVPFRFGELIELLVWKLVP